MSTGLDRQETSTHANTATRLALAIAGLALLAACSSDDDGGRTPGPGSTPGSTPTASSGGTPTPTPTSAITPTSPPLFTGYDLDLQEGTFWTYRWEYETRSCAQNSGCSNRNDDGQFSVTLGAPTRIEGVDAYEIEVSGKARVALANESRDFAPRWRHLGLEGDRILVSSGTRLTTLFDARNGFWAGSGFFSDRFESNELVQASRTQVREDFATTSWPGFRAGTAAAVGSAAQQSRCEQIAGLNICPREEAFSARENEYYREGVGALAYSFDFTASFSGGGFFSSSTTKERLGLVATSLRGDAAPPAGSDEPKPRALSEVGPNDTETQAQVLPMGVPLSGDIALGDFSGGPSVEVLVGGAPLLVGAEDHYLFDLAEDSLIEVSLLLGADLRQGVNVGLLLWDHETGQPVATTFDPGNISIGINTPLSGGVYRIGVSALETPRGRINYTLRVNVDEDGSR